LIRNFALLFFATIFFGCSSRNSFGFPEKEETLFLKQNTAYKLVVSDLEKEISRIENELKEIEELEKSGKNDEESLIKIDKKEILKISLLYANTQLSTLERPIPPKIVKIGKLQFQNFYPTGYFRSKNINDIFTYCQNLTIDEYSDWRNPTIKELKLVYENSNLFENLLDQWYSSKTESEKGGFFDLNMRTGETWITLNIEVYAICVRDEK
jgi:hypothetical protein